MNRSDFKAIARLRQREAKALLSSRNYSGAYYLVGYVVECSLKACIAKKTRQYDFPDKKVAQDSYTHNPADLIKVAGLQSDLNVEKAKDAVFELNWKVVQAWSEQSRYDRKSRGEAEDLIDAISDPAHGVLRWLELYW